MNTLKNLSTWMLAAMLLMPVGKAQAEEVSLQEAQQKARVFVTQQEGMTGGARRSGQQTHLKVAPMQVEGLYAFNLEGGGFVIVSGDDRTIPVLGYSTTGTLDWDKMPANMKEWLMGYAKSIAALGNLQAKDGNPIGWEGQTRRAPKAAIATLMSTKWSQTEPYYNMCPVYEGEGDNKGKLCVTGCTCTATAQVMAYHKWPKEACKAVPGYKLELWQGGVITGYQTLPDLPPVVFQWDKMLDEYHQGEQLIGTKEQQDAVAQLMRYAGQGMKMNYSPEESGTNPFMAADALKKYFGYDQGLQDVSRAHYGIAEWEDLIYNEIAAQRPVIYGGGAHTFVVDGYNGQGLFHVNWGWGGDSDNYFSLSLLNPGSWEGTGAGSSGIDYSTPQDAVIGVKPATTEQTYKKNHPSASLGDEMIISDDGKELTVQFSVQGYENKMTGIIAMAYKNTNGEWKQLSMSTVEISNTLLCSYTFTGDEGFQELTEVTKLVPMLSIEGYDEWKLLAKDDIYVTATPIGGGKVKFSKVHPQLELIEIPFNEPLTKGQINILKPTFKNNGAEFRGVFFIEPTYGNDKEPTVKDRGLQGVYLPAGQQTTLTLMFTPSKVGKVKIRITTTDNYEIFSFNTTVTEATGISELKDNMQPATGKYYNLSGRKLATKPTKKGVYIHHGKKFVFK